jgi:hypothetical protein
VLGRPSYIVGALAVCAIAGFVYFAIRTPEGVTPMNGDGSEAIAWISLAVAVLSLATAVVGLIQRLVELRATKNG